MKAGKVLGKDFYTRATLGVARDLLGKVLVSPAGEFVVTDVEVYDGPNDLASHASRGRTERNAPMFEAGGIWYVYLIYGMHNLVNIVVGPKDYPAAVLIRGLVGVPGPGRVGKALGMTRGDSGSPASRASGIYLKDVGFRPRPSDIICGPRIGVDYAGPVWSKKPYRLYLRDPGKYML